MLHSITLVALLLAGQIGSTPTEIVVEESLVVTKTIKTVRLPALEAGELMVLNVEVGQFVQANEEVGRLNDEVTRLERDRAMADLEIATRQAANEIDKKFAKSSHDVAIAELNRSIRAREQFAISVSQSEIDRLELMAIRGELSYDQATETQAVAQLTASLKEAEVRLAEAHVARRSIKSPLAGQVVEIFHQPGEWLSPGEPLVRIIQLDKLRVIAPVDGTKYGKELKDSKVELTVALPGGRMKTFNGHVTFVSPEVNEIKPEVEVWADVENKDGDLRAGVHGTLKIKVNEKK